MNALSGELNILGYSGSHLALIFETLSVLRFNGPVRVIMHDDNKYFNAPFETDVAFEAIRYDSLPAIPEKGFFFCSNHPLNKQFLYRIFQPVFQFDEDAFVSVVHPTSILASTVKYKGGLYMEPMSVVSAYSTIGFGVSINRLCSVGHHNIIGDYCSLYPGSHLPGDVELGRAVAIGPGTTVLAGVKIGDNSVIGGGSVVTQNIPANVVAYGNPCKVVSDVIPLENQTGII